VFSPLAQGLLTNKYLKNIPEDSRAAKPHGFLQKDSITPETLDKVRRLNDIAGQRGQTLAQMAIAWVLRHPNMTSALVGASSVKQVEDNIAALQNLDIDHDQLQAIEEILAG
jgi:L-glyceraldehyde 3-phosphate reductase